jgi:outer membrane protein
MRFILALLIGIIASTTLVFAADKEKPAFKEKLTLQEGLRLVTEENRLIRIKQQEEAISEADILVARSGLLPRINASYTQNQTQFQPGVRLGPQSAFTAERSFYTYSVALRQILYDFAGISSLYEASKKVFETKQLDTKRIKNGVALQFAFAYLDLLEAEKMATVAVKEKERLESHLKTAQNLYNEGVITKNDFLQAQVRLSDARQKLLTAENLAKILRSRLNNMLTRPLASHIEVEEVTRPLSTSAGLDAALEYAEKERYEVKIVNVTLEATALEESSKKSEFFPRFFMEGRYDYTKNKYQLEEGNWGLAVGMNINLLSGGSTRAELSKLTHQKLKLATERRKLIDDIKLEVERYYLEMINAGDKARVTKEAISQAEENLKINNVKYLEGVGTATEAVDAITLLTQAETNYYRSLYEFYRSEAGFFHAMGRDLPEVYR